MSPGVYTETKIGLSLLEACVSAPGTLLQTGAPPGLFVAPFSAIICSEIWSHNWDYCATLLIREHTLQHKRHKCVPEANAITERPPLLQHNCKHTIASSAWSLTLCSSPCVGFFFLFLSGDWRPLTAGSVSERSHSAARGDTSVSAAVS